MPDIKAVVVLITGEFLVVREDDGEIIPFVIDKQMQANPDCLNKRCIITYREGEPWPSSVKEVFLGDFRKHLMRVTNIAVA